MPHVTLALLIACCPPPEGGGGSSPWDVLSLPEVAAGKTLRSVTFLDAQAGWIVGDQGLCLQTLEEIPDRIIMKIVGHTTPNMVSRYAHLAPNTLKGATDCLDGGNRTPVVQKAPSRAVGKGRS